MQSAKKFTIQTVSDDLLRFKPALVAVDNNTGMAAPFKDFDFIAFFGQDPAFSAEWKHYSKAGQVTTGNADPDRPSGNYTIYKRTVGDSQ